MPATPSSPIALVECPRDAMQGLKLLIPAREKIRYLQALLAVGFDTLDCGSFVSRLVVPQMADTPEVLSALDRSGSSTKTLVIVANRKGIGLAADHPAVDCLGYPFSASETFQRRNTRRGIPEALDDVKELISTCGDCGKEAVIYISMAFGNPYGDPYDEWVVCQRVRQLVDLGATTISLADTVGVAEPAGISRLFGRLLPEFPQIRFGAHFHSDPGGWQPRIQAADGQGCSRFDSAMLGFGGCPMAADALVGNIATENLVRYFQATSRETGINREAFLRAQKMATGIFRET